MNKEEQLVIALYRKNIIINSILLLFKLIVGIIGYSGALIAEAIHSLTYLFKTFIVLIENIIDKKNINSKHYYNPQRFITLISFIMGLVFLLIGIIIAWYAFKKIIFDYDLIRKPSLIALIVAFISLIINEGIYHYISNLADNINSRILKNNTFQYHSKAMLSLISLIGILGTMLGLLSFDSFASIIISFFLIKTSLEIFKDNIEYFINPNYYEEFITGVRVLLITEPGVENINKLKTHIWGTYISLEIEVGIDENISFKDAHLIANHLHELLGKKYKRIKHCIVQVSPLSKVE